MSRHPAQLGPDRKPPVAVLAAARGGLKLVVDRSPPPARGLTGLAGWGSPGGLLRGGDGLDSLLAPFDFALAAGGPAPRREALVAALNGLLGDHLLRSGSPLAIDLQLRQQGQPLAPPILAALGPAAPRRVLLLVHGLCMSDIGWRRNGHDHGELLARALGAAPVYAHYNSGRHISDNGRALAQAIEQLLADWPVSLDEIIILGHSMGGLVARSALAQGAAAGQGWPGRVGALVFLGTPHHGAPLERAGNWLHRVMDLSPHAAPFSRLSRLRSDGITDLRHGHLLESDWQDTRRCHAADRRVPVPLPPQLQAYAIASTAGGPGITGSLLGDGLVPIDSALGRHRRRELELGLPESHRWVGRGIGHLDLLCDPAVYRRLLAWMT